MHYVAVTRLFDDLFPELLVFVRVYLTCHGERALSYLVVKLLVARVVREIVRINIPVYRVGEGDPVHAEPIKLGAENVHGAVRSKSEHKIPSFVRLFDPFILCRAPTLARK